MSNLSKLTKAELLALIEGANVTADLAGNARVVVAPAKKRRVRKGTKRVGKGAGARGKEKLETTKHLTEAFTLCEDRRSTIIGDDGELSFPWASDYAELAFCDAEGNAHSGKLREDDTLAHELIEEIKTFARANPQGRSKMRFNTQIGAWTAPKAMFSTRLRKLAGL